MNFSVAIPTYNRKNNLEELINSILNQTILPSEVIVVDDGNLHSDFIHRINYKLDTRNIRLIYYKKNHKKEKRGTSQSRNIAFEISKNEIVFILDDDLLLDSDFFEEILKVWEQEWNNHRLIGIGGVIKNNRKISKIENFFNHVLFLTSEYNWDVTNIGFQIWDDWINKTEIGYYVHGGVCSYRKNLVQKIGGFTVFEDGRVALEDVDFSLRAKKEKYYFVIVPSARVYHKKSKTSRENDFTTGFKEGYNRKIIFKRNCEINLKNYLWFTWANSGWILRQFLSGHFSRGLGMIKGIITNTKRMRRTPITF